MPRFRYEGLDDSGRVERGEIEGADEAQAYAMLASHGVTVTALGNTGASDLAAPRWWQRQIGTSRRTLTSGEEADLAEELAVLFGARLTIGTIVAILERSAAQRALRARFGRIRQFVAEGQPLATAFERAAIGTSPVFLAVLRLADHAAAPAELMRGLAAHLRRQDQIRAQVSGALLYPLILVVGALAILLIVALSLAPALAPMFLSLDRPVPAPIEGFLRLGNWLRRYGAVLALVVPVFALGLGFGLRQATARAALRRVTAQLPLAGGLLAFGDLVRLTRTLDLLLHSGLSLPRALRLTAGLFPTAIFASAFRTAAEALETGTRAAAVFEDDRRMPVLFRELFRVGEEANRLEEVLPSIARTLDERVERQTGQALRLIAPAVTLAIGGGIGLLIYSVMGAILSVNDLAF